MSVAGLSFGSATGGSGFDVSTTVSAILANSQAIETPWKSQLTALQAQDTVLSSLGTDLSTLTTKLQALTDFDGVFAEKEGSSSNPDVLALTSASSSATAGGHAITIQQLAQTSSVYTQAIGATDQLSGSLSIQVGSGQATTFTLSTGTDSLQTLRAAINNAGIGVTASLVTDSAGTRLAIISGTSGATGQLTVGSQITDATTGSGVATQAGQNGQDAQLNVDGLQLTSGSNTVTNAVPGVTLQLLNTSVAPVQVQITNNTADVAGAIGGLVTAYNTVVGDLAAQEGKNASGSAQPLFGSPTLALLQNALAGALLGGTASGSLSSATQLGISLNNDGTLTLNSSTLNAVLNSSFSDAEGFFQNSGSFGANFVTVLSGLGTQAPSGAIFLTQQQNATEEKALNANISNEEARLAVQKTTLTAELNQANEILQAIPEQLSEVDEMYAAITGYGEKG